MQKPNYFFAFVMLIIFLGCGPSKVDPMLQEAFEIHKQSLDIAKSTDDILNKIPSDDENQMKLQLELKEWNENLIEVPGFDNHQHDENCNHHNQSAKLELAPDHMLAIQNELQDSIKSIHQRALKLEEVLLQ